MKCCTEGLSYSLGRLGAWALIAAMLLPPNAIAGIFSVTPVRLFMTPRDRAIAVTIVNEGDTEIALQADINDWKQSADGVDDLKPTEDLILAPPIIKLAPRARQVVRLALLKPADASRELTYRMILREVPEAVPQKPDAVTVPISLALSMPVFITPPVAKRQITCTVVRPQPEALAATCQNTGTAYAQIREINLSRDGKSIARFEGGQYILPGARKLVALTSEAAAPTGEAKLEVTFDDNKTQGSSVSLP